MAMGGKLTKLKSVIKKWNSFGRQTGGSQSLNAIAAVASPSDDGDSIISTNLHPVYVGKSRRCYFLSSDIIDHPLFKELAERSGRSEGINIACEVVLFEHLLWMLENADPQPESMDELVDFYAC